MSFIPKKPEAEDTETESTSSVEMPRKTMSISIEIEDATAKERRQLDEMEFKLLCFDLRVLPPYLQFLSCCGGVFFFFLLYGYFQELIFSIEGFKPFGWYLTLVQFSLYTFFGFTESRLNGSETRKIPMKVYLLLALLTVVTMGFSNASLGYLNYPTQVIFKCCKLIPVMIGGILIQGKVFSAIDTVACLCMSVGLTFFTLADSSISPTFSMYGVLLISLALCADAAIGNVQEKMMKQYKASNAEVPVLFSVAYVFAVFPQMFFHKDDRYDSLRVLYSYAIGFIYILIGQVLTTQLLEAFIFCLKNPVIYAYIFVFSLTGFLGVNVVLNLVKMYGALIAVTVTTCRKAVTIVLSFVLFAKPFTTLYVWSGLVVVLGLYLNLYSKNQSAWNAQFKEWFKKLCPKHRRLVALQNLQHVV